MPNVSSYSLQWGNAPRRMTCALKRPSLQQFDALQIFPFEYLCQRSLREISIDATRLNFNGDFEIALNGMKMGRPMIPAIYGDDDTEEATQFGHASL
jgi:hypothetical protein